MCQGRRPMLLALKPRFGWSSLGTHMVNYVFTVWHGDYYDHYYVNIMLKGLNKYDTKTPIVFITGNNILLYIKEIGESYPFIS